MAPATRKCRKMIVDSENVPPKVNQLKRQCQVTHISNNVAKPVLADKTNIIGKINGLKTPELALDTKCDNKRLPSVIAEGSELFHGFIENDNFILEEKLKCLKIQVKSSIYRATVQRKLSFDVNKKLDVAIDTLKKRKQQTAVPLINNVDENHVALTSPTVGDITLKTRSAVRTKAVNKNEKIVAKTPKAGTKTQKIDNKSAKTMKKVPQGVSETPKTVLKTPNRITKTVARSPKNRMESGNKTVKTPNVLHMPVYKTVKPSPLKALENIDDMYEFEVDENEPVPKKTKRKPILKIKKYRTYKKKKKIPELIPLDLSDLNDSDSKLKILKRLAKAKSNQNINANLSHNDSILPENISQGVINSSNGVVSEISSYSKNTTFASDLNGSIDNVVAEREGNLYSPQPYESPKRDSFNVPVIRASVSHNNDIEYSKALNASTCNASIQSPYSTHFTSPMYLGSSTPIYRNHWSEHSHHYSNIIGTPCKEFDVSNCFGFVECEGIDAPRISPIKGYMTPGRTPGRTPIRTVIRKPSPVRLPHRKVIRMLQFGPEAADDSIDSSSISLDNSFQIDELLPLNFFHDGDTPSFSPTSTPSTPDHLKKVTKNNCNKGDRKKKHVLVIDSDVAAASTADDTTSHELDQTRSHKKSTRAKACPTKVKTVDETCIQTDHVSSRTRRKIVPVNEETELDADVGYETELSPVKETNEVSFVMKPRKSYERPAYLRRRKKYDSTDSEPEEEEVETLHDVIATSTKHVKKKNLLTKKEELELEKWAKAFNEQCMQVEGFNLVVE